MGKDVRATIHEGLGGKTTIVTKTPTISTSAYAAGDAVGGKMLFNAAVYGQNRTGILQSMTIIDDDLEDAELELWIFSEDFTATADNAAWDPTDADLQNLVGVVSTVDGAYYDATDNSVAVVKNIGLVLKLNSPTLYAQLVTRGTPTYTATDDLTVKLGILQD